MAFTRRKQVRLSLSCLKIQFLINFFDLVVTAHDRENEYEKII
jgi:hypothetical protein